MAGALGSRDCGPDDARMGTIRDVAMDHIVPASRPMHNSNKMNETLPGKQRST
ncbi:hypothetical protein [Burkholderia gladioli]|uniref:hypothetical protein n=1 Tax=Burkholderia gladioli TaxID=28095 RepID=UPI00163E0FB7|nr:hypothetical protein [Burkholderia gladioli]